MIVRPLLPADLPQVEEIERRAMPAPWSAAQVRAEIEAANGFALVAICGGTLGGYAFFRTCLPECELLHLVVAPEWRRRRVATALLDQALAGLAAQGCTTCFLEVRASNEAARQLYTRAGFVQTGRRKHYYSQPVEDALLLTRDMQPAREEHE
ncbi:ribosomal protein S18-alanine N-acetyltransferase [Desulfobulbus elongatus]|uniref:ribosomal protein S18-alanine N-acetyltransferase n=1 Tax=Desulfobulbus elongatus TaxID=53332 RepID=UPI000482D64F|nr:ribosomal protein S18-alanine N-acetyltransferase [Desulfobulbus elongatus]